MTIMFKGCIIRLQIKKEEEYILKKVFALLLVLTMVCAFCACGGDEPAQGTQVDNNPATEAAPTEAPTEVPTEAPTEVSTEVPTEAPIEDPTEIVEVETVPVEMGQITGLNYESGYIGIGCNLPEGWVFYTDEEIAALNGLTAGLMGDEYQQALQSADLLYDMHAANADGSNTNVILEKGSALELLVLNLENYVDSVSPSVAEAMLSMGFETYECEKSYVTISGEQMVCIRGVGTLMGATIYQYSIPVKCSGHLATISVCAATEEALDEIVNCFYLVG